MVSKTKLAYNTPPILFIRGENNEAFTKIPPPLARLTIPAAALAGTQCHQLKRLVPLMALAVFVLPNAGLAQHCKVEIGFEQAHQVVLEGNDAVVTINADFTGSIPDDYSVDVDYQTNSTPMWQFSQSNAGAVGADGGAVSGEDYDAINHGTIQLTKADPSDTIRIRVRADAEKERFESFHVNLAIPFDPNPTSTHRTREQACSDPVKRFRNNRYFSTVHIRDQG